MSNKVQTATPTRWTAGTFLPVSATALSFLFCNTQDCWLSQVATGDLDHRLPRGFLAGAIVEVWLVLRKVDNSGDISWHKTRIFISEVFRLEELALELTTPGFCRVYFRDLEVGELNAEELCFRAARRVV